MLGDKMTLIGITRRFASDAKDYIVKLKRLGVDIYEMGLAYGVVRFDWEGLKKRSDEINIKLSCHLPFFINLGNINKINLSKKHLKDGLKLAELFNSIGVFHAGYYGTKNFNELHPQIVHTLREVINYVSPKKGRLGIETTGKMMQIGTLEEVIKIVESVSSSHLVPVIDWAHLYARSQGRFPKTIEDVRKVLDLLEKRLDLKFLYFHTGGVIFGKGGEKKHKSCKKVPLLVVLPFLVLKEMGYNFTLIIETPDPLNDLTFVKEVYEEPEKWLVITQKRGVRVLTISKYKFT